ncbi:MAG: hypothetical protein HOW73_48935 [Polyangiaceae bacterium]|nr:hypothetical protein [Polyangiaceae bacterium]
MPNDDELERVRVSLATGTKTTAQLAIDCKWALPEASAKLHELEVEGLIARVTPPEEALNAYTVEWRAVSPGRVASRAARGAGDLNPYRPPSTDADVRAEGGNFWLGFFAGALGGIIIVVLFLRRGRPDTRRGVWLGVAFQIVSFVVWELMGW